MLATDPFEAALAAGLEYVTDAMPGIRRKRNHAGFEYFYPSGKRIRSESEIGRIKSLAIPPAYESVWISPNPNGHIQATARDARGRKQYRYHKRWREVRDEAKFERIVAFARALPGLRRRVEEDLALPGLPREKVLATVIRLLELTLVRVGNDEYAKSNRSYGLTTLRERHVRVDGSRVRFRFRGKSGVTHEVGIHDRRLASIVRKLVEIPGQDLFEYLDDEGVRHSVRSQDVNAYLREVTGGDFTAKDFRTLAATVLCALGLNAAPAPASKSEAKATVSAVVQSVAARLGNTPSVCRKAYLHPVLIEEFLTRGALRLPPPRAAAAVGGLQQDERRVVKTIERLVRRNERTSLTELLERSVEKA